jgi:hypothetical protein
MGGKIPEPIRRKVLIEWLEGISDVVIEGISMTMSIESNNICLAIHVNPSTVFYFNCMS